MKNNVLKKTVALFMAATMMFSVVGCGRKENESKADTGDMVYEAEELAVEGIEGDISSVFVKDDRLYLSTDGIKLYSMNLDGSDVKELPITNLEKDEYINYMSVSNDGSVHMLLSINDERTKSQTISICMVDKDGKERWKKDITNTLKLNSEQDYISRILCADKGRVLVFTNTQVYIFDDNAKSLGKMKADFTIQTAAKTKEGKIICGISGAEGAFVQEIDIDGKKWGKKHKVDISCFGGNDALMDGVEYDFYYKQENGIFGYDIKEDKATQVVDFVTSNLNSSDTQEIIPLGKEKFLGTSFSEKNGKKNLVTYNKVESSAVTDKKTITFGTTYADSTLKQSVIDFNKQSENYRIELITYEGAEDPEVKMNAEIAAGNIPDIMDLSGVNYNMYASKGLVEDLLPYIEKDKELSTEDFLPTVLEAMKTGDKLYAVSPDFFLTTLIGRTKDVGKEVGWTVDDMKAVIEKNKNTARPFGDNYKSTFVWNFIYSFDDFVDWETGKCNFESEEFKEILELCNTGENGESEHTEILYGNIEEYQKGEIMFSEGWVTIKDIPLYQKLFKEDITFIGYPDKDKSGSYFQFNQQIAISSKSENKEAAWEFVRTFLTKEYQGTQDNVRFNPIRKDCYDMMVKAVTTTEVYTDEFGNTVYPLEGTYGINDMVIENMKPLSKEDVAIYEKVINNTHKRVNYDDKIVEIIEEEANRYFAGDRDIDATAEIIQNRVTTYVNENR